MATPSPEPAPIAGVAAEAFLGEAGVDPAPFREKAVNEAASFSSTSDGRRTAGAGAGAGAGAAGAATKPALPAKGSSDTAVKPVTEVGDGWIGAAAPAKPKAASAGGAADAKSPKVSGKVFEKVSEKASEKAGFEGGLEGERGSKESSKSAQKDVRLGEAAALIRGELAGLNTDSNSASCSRSKATAMGAGLAGVAGAAGRAATAATVAGGGSGADGAASL